MFRFVAMAALLVAAASCAQVSSGDFIRPGGQYGRSDGVFQNVDTNGFDAIINGRHAGTVDKKTFYEDFTVYGDAGLYCLQDDYTACQGTAGSANILWFPSGNAVAQDSIVAQTIAGGADMDAGYLDIAGDLTDNDGLELYRGYDKLAQTGTPFIIGEDPAFFTCATLDLEDVSGTDDTHVGFRRCGAMNATFDNYTDVASIGPMSGNITIETIDDNGDTTTTDTGKDWADGAQHSLCVYISAAGVVTYTIDGSAPPTTAAFTWDDADPVCPFIHVLQAGSAANSTGEFQLLQWEVGYQ